MGGSDPGDGGVRPGDGGVRPGDGGVRPRGWGVGPPGTGGRDPGTRVSSILGTAPRAGPPPALPVAQPRTWVWHPKLEPFGCQVWGGPKDWGYKFWTYCDLSKNATSLRPVLIGRVEIGTPRSSDGGADFGMGGATTPSPGSDPPGWGGSDPFRGVRSGRRRKRTPNRGGGGSKKCLKLASSIYINTPRIPIPNLPTGKGRNRGGRVSKKVPKKEASLAVKK